jgi:hypothetical protein
MESGNLSPVTKKQKVEANDNGNQAYEKDRNLSEEDLLPLVSDVSTNDSSLRRFRRKLLNNKVRTSNLIDSYFL